MLRALGLGLFFSLARAAVGDVVISEWMHAGTGSLGEYVEFTNTGPGPVDMTGWSFDDDSGIAGTVSLSAFGIVAAGESVILTDDTPESFAAAWGLTDVQIVGGNTANLGRNDTINLYDAGGNLVDSLAYGDESYPGTVRTQTKSCNVPPTDYGYTVAQAAWVLAAVGDAYGSYASTRAEVGSPGTVVKFARNDFDLDGDVDVDDFAILSGCMTGPAMPYDPPPPACTLNPDTDGYLAADLDEDGDLDLADVSVFQICASGPGNPADVFCGESSEPPGETYINLHGTYITVEGDHVTVDGTTATITAQGTYIITGTLNDGRLVVSSADNGAVELRLNGVNVSNSTNAPIYVLAAGLVEVVLVDQTVNYLSDASTYVYEDPTADEPNAALFSKDSLRISGTGTLTVHGNYNDAIASKDELVIAGGTLNVIAVDDGIRGKDYLLVEGGDITVSAAGDGLKSDNADDVLLGYIAVEDGTIHVTSGGDALAAETAVLITGGDFTLLCGGGHTVTIPEDLSAKGIKGLASVAISGGTFNIDAADDAIHSNAAITVNAGTLTLATGDDALHSDLTLAINGGTIDITHCFEGIESADITITDGDFHILSSDDGITADANVNISGGEFTLICGGGHTVTIPSTASAKAIKGLVSVVIGGGTFSIDAADDGVHSNAAVTISGGTLTIATNSSTSASYGDGVHSDGAVNITGGTVTVTTGYEGIEGRFLTIDNGTIHVTTTDDGINAAGTASGNWLHINGGYIAVNAAGDGIDVNGSITMTGGTVIVHGPTQDYNAAIDYDGTFVISGGFLVAAGSAGMAQAPSNSSTQRSVKITYSQWKSAGTLVHIQKTSDSANILTFAPAKIYRSVVLSAPTLTAGTSYQLYRGGTCSGTVMDGLYSGGTYSGGTLTNTFTTTNIVTNVSAP
ncbi:MAG: carbohydrate-binding domain-containing protein [Phycisphaerae bacterium]|nr:carbohydrate-binding domain-containing protein [Phycisphaerae bacterium]